MNTVEQIRIRELTREVEQLRKKAEIAWALEIEQENRRLHRIEDAAKLVDENPNPFTLDILHSALGWE